MKQYLARQKFRFDMGLGVLQVLTYAGVAISASDKLSAVTHLPSKVIILLSVPLALGSVWLFGWLLDKWRYYDAYVHEANLRNQMLKDIHGRVK